MPKTVKRKSHTGGGLECITQMVRAQPPIFDYDRDIAVYTDVFKVPENAVRVFSYENEEQNIRDFHVQLQIDYVRTKFRIELGQKASSLSVVSFRSITRGWALLREKHLLHGYSMEIHGH